MKRHGRRRLRASILTNQAWAIHEPALVALFDLLAPEAPESRLTRAAINERIGVGAEMATTIQMVGSVAVLPVFGILQQRPSWLTRALGWTATEQLERDLKACMANDQVKAVVLYCDSPGGVAAGVDEVAATIYKSRKGKPLRGFVRGTCASAAYYLLSACDRIDATPSSTIGSIGTIYTHFEFAEALKEMGLGVTVIKHGERKGDGNPYEKLSPAARASLQHWVSAFGQMFDAAVAKHRGVTVADVRSRFGQGEAYLAQESKQRGLIDQVGTWEQLLATLNTAAAPLPQPGQILGVGSRESAIAASLLTPDPWPLAPALFASAIPAGVSAGAVTVPSPMASPALASPAEQERPPMKFSMRVRGALLARGLISAVDATDEICQVALGAYSAARGEACPQEDDKIIAALMGSPAAATSTAATQAAATQPAAATAAAPAHGAAPNVQQAHEREMGEARQQAEANVLARVKEIQASGKLLGMTQEQIDAAVQSGKPFAEVAADFTRELVKRDRPISQGSANVTAGQEGADRFAADACLAIQVRLDRVPASQASQVTDQVRQLSNAPLSYFAEQCLAMSGVRVPQFLPKEELFELAFAMDGPGRATVGASYSAYNRPGSFPNLLSNLANKVLDAALELAGTSYDQYTGKWPGDLPDFKPAPVVNKSQHDEMDEVLDGEASKEFGLAEEMLSYMLLRRYSNVFKLTPVMAANDDLGAFDEGLLGLEMGWQNTINRLCLRLLTGNVALLDGFALFDDTNHGNDLTGAGSGPPSVAAWEAMDLKLGAQRGVGGTGYIRSPLGVALVAPKHFVAALQLLAPLQLLAEMKVPTADSGINVYRGTATVVREPELQATSSDIWYGLCRPRGMVNATIVRAYFRGWGQNGRRQRWYDPETKCWNFELEGRVGAAAKQFRTVVRNDGVA